MALMDFATAYGRKKKALDEFNAKRDAAQGPIEGEVPEAPTAAEGMNALSLISGVGSALGKMGGSTGVPDNSVLKPYETPAEEPKPKKRNRWTLE